MVDCSRITPEAGMVVQIPPMSIPLSDNVATVDHGVPLMRSKWVHRLWAHQEGEPDKDSRPVDGPPHLPHGIDNHG